MLDNIYGVPTHALVVHAVVVLLPLAALTGVAGVLVLAELHGQLVPIGADVQKLAHQLGGRDQVLGRFDEHREEPVVPRGET